MIHGGMHTMVSPAWDAWSALSTLLPADLDLDTLARTTGAIQRQRGDGVCDGTTLLRLSLARGPGGKSLSATAAWAHLNGIAELTGQSLKGAEQLLRCAPVAREVLIADRGYARAKELRACLDPSGPNARGFIVRVGWKALALHGQNDTPFDLIAHLEEPFPGDGPRQWTVRVAARARHALAPLRLIAVPLPADKVEAIRTKLRQNASRKQKKLDPRTLVAAGFMVLATSLPEDIPADEILAACRPRWQIEIAFKRLKSLIHIDRLPARTVAGSLSWLYPHLILTLLIDDMSQDFLVSSP